MDNLTLTFLVICSVLLVLVIIGIIVIILKYNKNSSVSNQPDNREIIQFSGEIRAKLENLGTNLNLNIEKSVSEQNLKTLDYLNKNNELSNEKLERFQKHISESIDNKFISLNKEVNNQLSSINKRVDERLEGGFKNTNETVQSVVERLAKIDAAQKNIESLSTEVVSLKNVLSNNQQRGQYGEFQLKMILHSVFGDNVTSYQEQYTIKSSDIEENTVRADAVVFLPAPHKMLCIDSKFPFQDYKNIIESNPNEIDLDKDRKNFRMAVKKHINDIKSKYIIPNKTAQQAFMFVPSDGIFSYIHTQMQDVVEAAARDNVIITSPSTLQAMLTTISMLKIRYETSKHLGVIQKEVGNLSKDFDKWVSDWEKLSKRFQEINNTQLSLDKRVGLMQNKFTKISKVQIDIGETDVSIPLEIASEREEE